MNLPCPIRMVMKPAHGPTSAYDSIDLSILKKDKWHSVGYIIYSPREVGIVMVRKRYRKQGIGTFLLRCVLHMADKRKWELHLDVAEHYGASEEHLIRWYRSHGFRVKRRPSFGHRLVYGAMVEMTRRPR